MGVGRLLCRWLPEGASLSLVFVPCGRGGVDEEEEEEEKNYLSQQIFLQL